MSKAWWDEYDINWNADRVSIGVEAPEVFDNPCGFVRLRERHRVKATSVRYGKALEAQNSTDRTRPKQK